ncbi:hypothetical protein [Longispora urticae]
MRTKFLVALSVAALALTGCAGGPSGAADALAKVEAPEWLGKPADTTKGDNLVRTYVGVPRRAAEAESAYSQALDRAGWRFHEGGPTCGKNPTKDGCWTADDLLITVSGSGNDSATPDATPAITLTVVVSAKG